MANFRSARWSNTRGGSAAMPSARCIIQAGSFPAPPNSAAKAGPILDSYKRVWEGTPLGADDYVIFSDKKASIQSRRRKHSALPPAPYRPMAVEYEYFREGAWTDLAAWDVHRARFSAAAKSEAARMSRRNGQGTCSLNANLHAGHSVLSAPDRSV